MVGLNSPSIIPFDMRNELRILDEIDFPVWIATYQPGDTRFLWANESALRIWNKTNLEAFASTDIVTGRSIAISLVHEELFHDVQVELIYILCDCLDVLIFML